MLFLYSSCKLSLSFLQGLESSVLYFPALNQQDAASWWKHATFVKEAALPAAAPPEPAPLSACKAANSPRAEPAPLDLPAEQDAVGQWKHAFPVKEAAPPAAASKEPSPLSASEAASSPRAKPASVVSSAEQDAVRWWKHEVPVKDAAPPAAASKEPSLLSTTSASKAARAERAPVDLSAKQDPAAGHEPASLWTEVMRPVKAAVHGVPSSEPAATTGSCQAQDLRAVHYTAAAGAALLALTVIWSVARRMSSRYGAYRHKRSPLALAWSPHRKGRCNARRS